MQEGRAANHTADTPEIKTNSPNYFRNMSFHPSTQSQGNMLGVLRTNVPPTQQ